MARYPAAAPVWRQAQLVSGTPWAAPAGLLGGKAWLTGSAGGAGGGCSTGSTSGGGGGGGAGDECEDLEVSVTPGTSYTPTLGAAGSAGIRTPLTAATAGGNTTFGALLTLVGGQPGGNATNAAGGANANVPGARCGQRGEAYIATYATSPRGGQGGRGRANSGSGGQGGNSDEDGRAGAPGSLFIRWLELA